MVDLRGNAPLPLASEYARFGRRHAGRIIVTIAVGLLGGLGVTLVQPATYSATASVALTPVPVYVMPTVPELAPPPVSIDTDAQLLLSPPVLEAVGQALGVDPEESERHLSVSATANSHILHVTVRDTDRDRAEHAADAAALALIAVRRETLGSLTHEQIRQVRFQALAQEGLLAREQARRVVVPSRDDLFSSLLELRTRVSELREARAEPALVIAPAANRGRTDYANTEVPLTSGAALGLVLGCLLSAFRDRSGARRPDPEENEDVT